LIDGQASDQLHRDEDALGARARVVDRDHVRVGEARDRACFS
jgi:hypothetical protein